MSHTYLLCAHLTVKDPRIYIVNLHVMSVLSINSSFMFIGSMRDLPP